MSNQHNRTPYSYCPLCHSEKFEKLGVCDCSQHPLYSPQLTNIITWQRCEECNHVFTEGYFSDEASEILAGNVNPKRVLDHKLAETQRVISGRMISAVSNKRNSISGTWLDIGFGSGALLLTAKEFGYDVVGVELRQAYVDTISKFDVDVRCMDIMDLKEYDSFDVISMADVLEHIPFPKDIIQHVYKLLKPNGIFFVSMPNMDSFIWNMWDEAKSNMYWGEIEHCHNFTRQRLYQLLEEFGLMPIHYGISERYRVCMEVMAIKKQS